MAHAKYIDLIAKYLSGNLGAPERTELLQWAEADPENQKFFDEMVSLWTLTEAYEEEAFDVNVPAAWDKLDLRIGGSDMPSASGGSASVIPLSVRSVFLRVAAATILLVAASYGVYSVWTNSNGPEIQYAITQADERREVTLPDGSQVWLNENTRLSYAEDFTERTVELEGEAFFDVARQENNPFVINSGEAQTTVLGTAFNVRAYPEEAQVEVTVQRGKVTLGKKTSEVVQPVEAILLEAGSTGVFDRPEARVSKVEEKLVNADSWKTGVLTLDGLNMEEVIKVLERYYNVDLEVDNEAILKCSVTKLAYEREPLDTVLKGLTFMMNLNIQQQPSDTAIVFSGRGCPE